MKTNAKSGLLAALALSGAAVLLVGAGGTAPKTDKAEGGHHHASTKEAAANEKSEATRPGDWKQGTVMTITAEVMDPACYLEAGGKSIGPGHFQCAVDCARSGQTLALLDRANDRIYFIAGELPGKNPNDPVMQFIHKKVDVRGPVYYRSGAWGIVIQSVTPHRDTPSAQATPKASGETKD